MRDFSSLALQHTLSCFFNSLLREYQNFTFEDSSVVIKLSTEKDLLIPLRKKSLVGRHEYAGTFFLRHQGVESQSINFNQALDLLLTHLCEYWKEDLSKKELFLQRLQNSLHNMQQSLHARESDLEKLYSENISFVDAEQGLMIGHNFHPYPKMREGFDDKDFEVYSPEMAGHFPLHWFFVRPEVLHLQTAQAFATQDWTTRLFKAESSNAIPVGYIPFPVHPWQRQHLLKNKDIQKYLQEKQILEDKTSNQSWYPTSSLRSIYGPHSPYMLKFSLTLRLTNSVRHLTNVEVIRGLQVYDVLSTPTGKKFLKEHPQFEVIFEPAFAALKNSEGQIISESIVVCRENPFLGKAIEQNVVVSTLAQDNPLGGDTLIWKHVQTHARKNGLSLSSASREWFKAYLHVALKPFIAAQAQYGILLGAHQQNMILQIEKGLPQKAYFRDCQGTGYSEHGYNLFHKDVASLTRDNGNILDNKGNILFAYYLLVNSTWNVLAALSHSDGLSEKVLLQDLKAFLLEMKTPGLPDTSFLDYVLNEARIYQKGNFICSLQNLNENTTANPLAIYNLIDNPLCQKENSL